LSILAVSLSRLKGSGKEGGIVKHYLLVLLLVVPCVEAAESTPATYDVRALPPGVTELLSEDAKALLSKQGFVVAGQQFKQIFEAYIGGAMPPFITTDSAWHTYHVLFEEGVHQLEEAQAQRLLKFSRLLCEAAQKHADRNRAYEDILQYASVGLALQDAESLKNLSAKQRGPVNELVAQLKGSSEVSVLFFGLPIMGKRLTPTGFYTGSASLRGYFSARQWYALCDFRAISEPETLRAFYLALLIRENADLKKLYGELTQSYDALLAKAEDGDVTRYLEIAAEVLDRDVVETDLDRNIRTLQDALKAKLPDPQVNDQLLEPEDYEDFPGLTKGFRLFPPRRIPSAVVFQKAVDPAIEGRMFPSGVDFFAGGSLASLAAKRAVMYQEKSSTRAQAILELPSIALPDSLHGEALKLLKLLQKPLPQSAPDPLKTDAWHDKQLQTQLAAWAEQRHTWALHTKLTVHYMGVTFNKAGIVSPYPDFFEGLQELSSKSAATFKALTLNRKTDTKAPAKRLLRAIAICKRLTVSEPGEERELPTEEEFAELELAFEFFAHYFKRSEPASREEAKAKMLELEKTAREWAEGKKPAPEDLAGLRLFETIPGEVAPLLRQLSKTCSMLAEITRMQLAGEALDDHHRSFMRDYGIELSKLHFYGGNSYLSPRDDFPVCTPIFVSPIHNQILYAGLARPEALYVYVNIAGEHILHRGAVLSYREFRDSDDHVLTDEAWRQRIRTGNVPATPGFTASFRAQGEFPLD